MEFHPLRNSIEEELHARPFSVLSESCSVAFLAVKLPKSASKRDKSRDLAHINNLLEHYDQNPLKKFTNHHYVDAGDIKIKWECHTEFTTYTIFTTNKFERRFDPKLFDLFPQKWLDTLDGSNIKSVLIELEKSDISQEEVIAIAKANFEPESLAISSVLDNSAIIINDFRLYQDGHGHIAIFQPLSTGPQRSGRIVQRLLEIESYRTIALLALPSARDLGKELSKAERKLSKLISHVRTEKKNPDKTLDELLRLSADLEGMIAKHTYRFSASRAYSALVSQRVAMLREERIASMQTLQEFMMRRFQPAMRTCEATETRLRQITKRTERAGNLLRTRVEVQRSMQNQGILKSLDRRANIQLRMQKTVEGLSVVAISYYAVNLLGGLLAPFLKTWGFNKYTLISIITIPVVLIIWLLVRKIKNIHSE